MDTATHQSEKRSRERQQQSKPYKSMVGRVGKQAAGTAVRRGGMGKCLNGRVSGDSGRFLRGLCLVFFAVWLGGLGVARR